MGRTSKENHQSLKWAWCLSYLRPCRTWKDSLVLIWNFWAQCPSYVCPIIPDQVLSKMNNLSWSMIHGCVWVPPTDPPDCISLEATLWFEKPTGFGNGSRGRGVSICHLLIERFFVFLTGSDSISRKSNITLPNLSKYFQRYTWISEIGNEDMFE